MVYFRMQRHTYYWPSVLLLSSCKMEWTSNNNVNFSFWLTSWTKISKSDEQFHYIGMYCARANRFFNNVLRRKAMTGHTLFCSIFFTFFSCHLIIIIISLMIVIVIVTVTQSLWEKNKACVCDEDYDEYKNYVLVSCWREGGAGTEILGLLHYQPASIIANIFIIMIMYVDDI